MASDKVTIDINDLIALKDIEPNTHAGCYELVQRAIELYGKVGGPANFTIADLDMIMFFTQIIKDFKKLEGAIDNSSLPDTSKTTLKNLLVHVQQKIRRGEYRNVDHGVGIVADLPKTLRAYVKRGLTDDKVSQLIKKLVEISSKDGLDAIFETAKEMPRITGINDGILSPILHCIKPNVFPIWNNSSRLFFLRLPIKLPCDPQGYFKDFPKDYIEASEKLNQFRDEYHLQFKNWRVIDLEAFKIGSAATAKEPSSSENSSGNLKESFRSWLVENLNSKPERRNELANLYVERIEKLAEHQTGKSPTVGIFAVRTSKQFDSFYKSAIEWALNYDKEGHRYWKQPITHYVRFLQDYFNPVSGSGDLSYVELKDENDVILPRNLIYFGAPGTGKSFKLKEAVEAKRDENGKPVEEDKNGTAIDYERVTFYPTYSYAQFVGCYKPVMESTQATEKLSSQQLAQILKRESKVETGMKEAAILLFAEQYYDSLLEADIGDIVEQAGLAKKTENSHVRATLAVGKRLVELRGRSKAGRSQAEIAYKFVPGPFLRVLVNALNEKPGEDGKKKNWCLVIEEINRANAAAVFGDVFQLLDRNDKGESEYDVAASEDIRKYLAEVITSQEAREFLAVKTDDKGNWTECQLRIPSNMYIWATMNSADQGVFPMDTAFKRRWEFEYIPIDAGEDAAPAGKKKPTEWTIDGVKDAKGNAYNWNEVRKFVNSLLSLHGVNEDKLMGAHFVQAPDGVVSAKAFESKVLMYLWEDAGRMCRKDLFDDIATYSNLLKDWHGTDKVKAKGIKVFDRDKKREGLESELKDWYKNVTEAPSAD